MVETENVEASNWMQRIAVNTLVAGFILGLAYLARRTRR